MIHDSYIRRDRANTTRSCVYTALECAHVYVLEYHGRGSQSLQVPGGQRV
jgi:hypothetical protein